MVTSTMGAHDAGVDRETKKAALARVDEAWERFAAMMGDAGSAPVLPDDKDALAEERVAYLQEKQSSSYE